jgi:hypothetical protein
MEWRIPHLIGSKIDLVASGPDPSLSLNPDLIE